MEEVPLNTKKTSSGTNFVQRCVSKLKQAFCRKVTEYGPPTDGKKKPKTKLKTRSLAVTDIHSVKSLFDVPACTPGFEKPNSGKRVRETTPSFSSWKGYHTLFLPHNWSSTSKRTYPAIFEYPGNEWAKGEVDESTGLPEGCKMGYGLSGGGQDFIWVSLPFLDKNTKNVATFWWGDANATTSYCIATAKYICDAYGGDPGRLFLAGFSRGAIACNYIGLRNDAIASLWKGMVLYSHYDGIRKWNYPESSEKDAVRRLKRLGNTPQLITQEWGTDLTQKFLKKNHPKGSFTFISVPYPNHNDIWLSKDIPEAEDARDWIRRVAGFTG